MPNVDTQPAGPLFVLIKGGLYWRPKSCGYTSDLLHAGLYSDEESAVYLGPSFGNEITREPVAEAIAKMTDRARAGFDDTDPRMLAMFDSARAAAISPTWPHVLAFARRMEAKLEANRHKGNREGWLKDSPFDLFRRLRDESDELAEALRCNSEHEVVANEAADVANFAMMIADVAGGGR